MSRLTKLKDLKRSLVSVHLSEPELTLRIALGNMMIELDAEISKAEIEQVDNLLAAVRELSDADGKEEQP